MTTPLYQRRKRHGNMFARRIGRLLSSWTHRPIRELSQRNWSSSSLPTTYGFRQPWWEWYPIATSKCWNWHTYVHVHLSLHVSITHCSCFDFHDLYIYIYRGGWFELSQLSCLSGSVAEQLPRMLVQLHLATAHEKVDLHCVVLYCFGGCNNVLCCIVLRVVPVPSGPSTTWRIPFSYITTFHDTMMWDVMYSPVTCMHT